jgi:hypothetical protein
MKKSMHVLLILSLALCVALGYAQEKKKSQKEATVQGEVVDVSCYLAHGKDGTGEGHKACAEACAQHGGPLGILTADGKLYVSVMPDDHKAGPNELLMDHIAQQVSATGIVRSKSGVRGIMISKVEAAEPAKTEKKQ